MVLLFAELRLRHCWIVGTEFDYDIVVNEFELHFQTNILSKGMNLLTLLSIG